ncbi:EAL domain-containing protein [Pseudomonas sp. R2.Fl]|nr:EAL domain-containing protein [Pseudomonas sp. R2.Fl]
MRAKTASPPTRSSTDDPGAMLLEALPQPAIVVDTAGAILSCNAPFATLLSGRSLNRTGIVDLVAPHDRAAFLASLAAAMTGHQAGTPIEVRWQPGRQARKALVLIAPLADQLGIPHILLQFVDITARAAREEELGKRESRWNQALINSETGIWDHNFKTGEMYYSDVWRGIRGLGMDEPLAANTEGWLETVHPDDRDRVRYSLKRQNLGDPEYMSFEYRERHKDGHWIWIECRGNGAEHGPDGLPTRIIGIDIDITARKLQEELMEKMSRRLKLALEVSRVGVFEADFDTGSSTWDDGMRKVFGVNPNAEVQIGGLWESLLHPDDAERVLKKVDYHVAHLLPFSDEYRVILSDGKEHFIRSRTLPFIDTDGHRKMIGANWDVTEDLALARELERAKTLAEARNRELESARQRMEHIALHDHLTDLPNRRYLDTMLDSMVELCRREGKRLGVLHIDLDRFKQINDTLGHNAGDAMLKHAAQILLAKVRSQDFVARIGGDEFVVLVPFDGIGKKLAKIAGRIIDEMRKPVLLDGHECRFGSSIGIAASRGADIDARQLLLNADMALYHAKNRGRNRFEFFHDDDQMLAVTTKRLSDDILRGLEQDEFVPVYQFQFDARSLDVVGVETLVRWRHPERGMLTPNMFLKAAEDLDVVSDIDGRLLDKALADMRRWHALGIDVPKVSVNVSSRRLHDPNLRKALANVEIPAGALSFELLESIFLDDFDAQVKENLKLLRKLGISIEIDDFGTGHASIVSLLRLNPQALKIDRELVRKVPDSQEQRQLVRSIIEIGHSLDVKVVAEGVETDSHVRALRDLGCDVLQGYGLAKPMPFERTEAFLKAQTWRRPDAALADGGSGRRKKKSRA